VWLSRWYLENLNALFSGPLDYDLWRRLNERSPIASRLYEFLFLKFYGSRAVLRFNYRNLVKFIPARTERYASQARKQLGPALDLLREFGVLRDASWGTSRDGSPQIRLLPGRVLQGATAGGALAFEIDEEDFVLGEIRNARPPELSLVEEYHRLWGHENFRPSRAEVAKARELLARHGRDALRELLPGVVKRLQEQWPDAKTFVAVERYLGDAAEEHAREGRRAARAEEERQAAEREREEATRLAKDRAALKLLWDRLPEGEREAIRRDVLSKQPRGLAKRPVLLERLCLSALAERQGSAARR
jgi:hypothetical protein